MLDSRRLLEGVASGLGDYRRRLAVELLLLLTLRREELLLALGTYGGRLLLVELLLRLKALRRRSLVVHGLRVEGRVLTHGSAVLRSALVVDHALRLHLHRDSDRNGGGAGRDGVTVESGAAVAARGNAVNDERDEEEQAAREGAWSVLKQHNKAELARRLTTPVRQDQKQWQEWHRR